MRQPDALQVRRVLIVQLVMMFVLTAAAWPFGRLVAISVLIGAAVCVVANSVFAFRVFRRYRAQELGTLLMSFYGAEVIKLSLVLGLFAVAYAAVEGLSVPALLAAYLAVQVLPAVFASGWGARTTRER